MYKGQIKGFPEEIVEKMLYYQEQQGNKKDVSIFEESRGRNKRDRGFTWGQTLEGDSFWSKIICYRQFDLFFEKYLKVKEYTIEDLRDGEVALEYNETIDTVDDLNKILNKVFPKNYRARGYNTFYFSSILRPEQWNSNDRTDLPAQPLSTFLKQIQNMKQTLTRKQLVELHNAFTCTDWRSAIQNLLKQYWELDEIEIPQNLIDKLLRDGTSDQKAKVKEYGIVLETPCPYKDGELILVKTINDVWHLRYATGVMEDGRAQVYDYQEKKSNCKSYYKSHAPAHGVKLPG